MSQITKQTLSNMPRKLQEIVEVLGNNPKWTNQDIAGALGKSENTVGNQLSKIYRWLNIEGDWCGKRIQLVLVAQGFITEPYKAIVYYSTTGQQTYDSRTIRREVLLDKDALFKSLWDIHMVIPSVNNTGQRRNFVSAEFVMRDGSILPQAIRDEYSSWSRELIEDEDL